MPFSVNSEIFFKKTNLLFIFFIGYLFVGLTVYDDYGVHLDEVNNLNYGRNMFFFFERILQGGEIESFRHIIYSEHSKEHGAVFELIFQYIIQPTDTVMNKEIILYHHLYTFLIFYISSLFFGKLAYDLTKDVYLTIIASIIYVFHPRIFSHSFYNTTDISLLAAVTVSLYFCHKFFKNSNIKNSLPFAFFTAFAVNVRFAALVIPLLVIVYFITSFSHFFRNKISWKGFLAYFTALVFFYVLISPSTWFDPLYPLETYEATVNHTFHPTPWFYNLHWFFYTTPVASIFLLICGLIHGLYLIIREKGFEGDLHKAYFISSFIFFSSIILPIIYKIRLYDGWRHHFFIYSSAVVLCIIGLTGLKTLAKRFTTKNSSLSIFLIFILLYLHPLSFIIDYHPNQQIYGNILVDAEKTQLRHTHLYPNKTTNKTVNLDYWHLSMRQTLEYLLENTEGELKISPSPNLLKTQMFSDEKQVKRIIQVLPSDADFHLTNVVYKDFDYKPYLFYSITYDGVRVFSIYDFRTLGGNETKPW